MDKSEAYFSQAKQLINFPDTNLSTPEVWYEKTAENQSKELQFYKRDSVVYLFI